MKLFKALVAGAALMLATAGAHAEIRVGIMNEPLPPLFSKDASGQWHGWEIDILNAMCDQMKEKCTIVDMAWDGLIPALMAKKFDVIWSDMSITAERKKRIDFTDKVYVVPSKVIGPKNGKKGVTPEDLAGATIGIQVSTIQEKYFQKYFAAKSTLKTYATLDESLQDLAAGRIDYAFAVAIPLTEFLKTDIGKACCEDKGDVKFDPDIQGNGIGGGVRKEDTELRERLNKAIDAIRASGKYDEITKKYFDFDMYGK